MVFPCSDAHARHNAPAKTQIEHQTEAHNHDNVEVCTPFCVCGGCVAAVVVHPPLDVILHIPAGPTLQEPVFYQSLQSFFKGSIWQPPQLL